MSGDPGDAISADEALKAEDARYAAQISNDFDSMQRMFGDDLVYIHSSGTVDDKASYIERQRSNAVSYRSMRRRNVTVRVYGCLAIITGNGSFDVIQKGEDRTVELLFHSVWVKRDSAVQFVSWQSAQAPPKP